MRVDTMPPARIDKLKAILTAIGLLLAVSGMVGCGGEGDGGGDESAAGAGLPQGSEPVDLNPVDFTTEIGRASCRERVS